MVTIAEKGDICETAKREPDKGMNRPEAAARNMTASMAKRCTSPEELETTATIDPTEFAAKTVVMKMGMKNNNFELNEGMVEEIIAMGILSWKTSISELAAIYSPIIAFLDDGVTINLSRRPLSLSLASPTAEPNTPRKMIRREIRLDASPGEIPANAMGKTRIMGRMNLKARVFLIFVSSINSFVKKLVGCIHRPSFEINSCNSGQATSAL